ncbi:MAG TPA: hypothetical protein DEP36_09465 [Gammaproteobacteria bacterium]|nr:hypothetical protein [Gammaproteobacteria bacterium]
MRCQYRACWSQGDRQPHYAPRSWPHTVFLTLPVRLAMRRRPNGFWQPYAYVCWLLRMGPVSQFIFQGFEAAVDLHEDDMINLH